MSCTDVGKRIPRDTALWTMLYLVHKTTHVVDEGLVGLCPSILLMSHVTHENVVVQAPLQASLPQHGLSGTGVTAHPVSSQLGPCSKLMDTLRLTVSISIYPCLKDVD